jgi:hypothetical protein
MNIVMNLLAPMIYAATGIVAAPAALWLVRGELPTARSSR